MTSFFTKLNALCQQVSSSSTASSGPNKKKQQQHGLTDNQWERCKRTGWSHFFESLLDGQQRRSKDMRQEVGGHLDHHHYPGHPDHHHQTPKQSPFLALAVFGYRLRALYSRQDEANALDQLCRELQRSMRDRTILLTDALQDARPVEPACVTEKLQRSTLKQQRLTTMEQSSSSSSSTEESVQQWQEPEAILRLLLALATMPPAKKLQLPVARRLLSLEPSTVAKEHLPLPFAYGRDSFQYQHEIVNDLPFDVYYPEHTFQGIPETLQYPETSVSLQEDGDHDFHTMNSTIGLSFGTDSFRDIFQEPSLCVSNQESSVDDYESMLAVNECQANEELWEQAAISTSKFKEMIYTWDCPRDLFVRSGIPKTYDHMRLMMNANVESSSSRFVSPYISEASLDVAEHAYRRFFDHDLSFGEHENLVDRDSLLKVSQLVELPSVSHVTKSFSFTKSLQYLLVGLSSTFFFFDLQVHAFGSVGGILRPLRFKGCSAAAMRTVITTFITMGTEFRRLELMCQYLMTESPKHSHGLVVRAFASALSTYLDQVRTELLATEADSVFHMMDGWKSVCICIAELARFCCCSYDLKMMPAKDNPYQTPEAVLHHLSLDARHQWKLQKGFFLPRGSNLLSRLYEWTQRHETMNTDASYSRKNLRSVFLHLLAESLGPFWSMLNHWLALAKKDDDGCDYYDLRWKDPFNEFFIAFYGDSKGDPVTADPLADRQFWTHQYQINMKQPCPAFFPATLVESILLAGKSIRLLTEFLPHELFLLDGDKNMLACDLYLKEENRLKLAHSVDWYQGEIKRRIAAYEAVIVAYQRALKKAVSVKREAARLLVSQRLEREQAERRVRAQESVASQTSYRTALDRQVSQRRESQRKEQLAEKAALVSQAEKNHFARETIEQAKLDMLAKFVEAEREIADKTRRASWVVRRLDPKKVLKFLDLYRDGEEDDAALRVDDLPVEKGAGDADVVMTGVASDEDVAPAVEQHQADRVPAVKERVPELPVSELPADEVAHETPVTGHLETAEETPSETQDPDESFVTADDELDDVPVEAVASLKITGEMLPTPQPSVLTVASTSSEASHSPIPFTDIPSPRIFDLPAKMEYEAIPPRTATHERIIDDLQNVPEEDVSRDIQRLVDSTVVHPILSTQLELIHHAALWFFFRHLQFRRHIKILGDYFLFQNGLFSLQLTESCLFGQSKWYDGNANEHWIWNEGLEHAISVSSRPELPEVSDTYNVVGCSNYLKQRFSFLIDMEESAAVNGLFLDRLQLHYKMDYPLSVVISEQSLERYSSLFKWLLRLRYHELLLTNTHRVVVNATKLQRSSRAIGTGSVDAFTCRFQQVLYEVSYFTRTLISFIHEVCVGETYGDFQKYLKQLEHSVVGRFNTSGGGGDESASANSWKDSRHWNLCKLRQTHDLFVDRLMFRVFLHDQMKPVHKIISGILDLSAQVVQLWSGDDGLDFASQQRRDSTLEQFYQRFRMVASMLVRVLQTIIHKGSRASGRTRWDSDDKPQADLIRFMESLLQRLDFNGFVSRTYKGRGVDPSGSETKS